MRQGDVAEAFGLPVGAGDDGGDFGGRRVDVGEGEDV